jgi:hypothetical protein
MLQELPGQVVELMQSGHITEFATVSAAGVPIDTPVLYFPSERLRSFDLATGLSYPAKAERARRNPKVGLLIEGGPAEPVISIAGIAAVRDSDLQANVHRYLSEAGYMLPGDPDWALARKAVWYWTRIIVEVTPARVLWWDSSQHMNCSPRCWNASGDTLYPQSDPAPPGAPSTAPHWERQGWPTLARQALSRGASAHLSLIDSEGFPLSIRTRKIASNEQGFTLDLPSGVPWIRAGMASLTFQGIETFIGEVTQSGAQLRMRVDRALPVFPMTSDTTELWEPSPDTYAGLMRRLRHETQRRGQPIPDIPIERPPPTEGYMRRMARRRLQRPTQA